jgi:chain length determinant protein EpsF
MTLSQFFAILRARWISILIVMLITVGSTVSASLVLPKKYTATASVLVDLRSPDPILGMAMGSIMAPSYMATQVDVIQSERVARRVVIMLRLTENPQLRTDWQMDTGGAGNFEAWISQLLQKQLDVKPSRESNVVNVSYTGTDPKFAAGMANAFVKAYLDTTLELRVEPAKRYTDFFDERAKELSINLEKAEAKLSSYQKEKGILATDERLDVESQRLNELSSQLVALQAVSAESTSRTAQARSSKDQLQDVIANPVIAGLRADVSRQEARLQELQSRYGDAHPQVLELVANIASLRQRIDTETQRVAGSVGINNNINKSREAEVRAALDAQRTKVLQMKAQRDEVASLLRDVDIARRAFETVAQRQTQTSLDSQINQTNVSILTPATEPATHSSPRILRNGLISVFFGSMLAVLIAVIRELLGRRVRTAQDISQLLDTPVLGTLPRPQRRKIFGGNPFTMPAGLTARLPSPGK